LFYGKISEFLYLFLGDGDGVHFTGFNTSLAPYAFGWIDRDGNPILNLVDFHRAGIFAVTISITETGINFDYVTHFKYYLSFGLLVYEISLQ
jgi:hypothetical protein